MTKGNGRTERALRRRNRKIGIVILVALVAGCWLYYGYCMGSGPFALPSVAGVTVSQRPGGHGSDMPAADSTRCGERTAEAAEDVQSAADESVRPAGLELPYYDSDDLVLHNDDGRYTFMYDTLYKQSAWVAYMLTAEDADGGNATRRDRFVPDPAVVERGYPTAVTSDYKGSGYDRGHLCPSADRTCSQAENDCTFYMSNISPQTPALNRGPWKALEEQVRQWAVDCDTVYVVTGGVLEPGLDTIAGGVGIPEYFYKAVMTVYGGEYRTIGFLLPNAERFDDTFLDYTVTVDSLEAVTSLDLFHNMPDSCEERAESGVSSGFWFGR